MTTLILDRDGVINERLPGRYVREWAEFKFIPGTLEAIAKFTEHYNYIFILTNQQGIGKRLMDAQMLENIHQKMINAIQKAGGSINAVYFCPALEVKGPFCRKPRSGMAYQIQRDFPFVDFRNTTMVGDMHTDIRFAHHLGMKSIWLNPNENAPTKLRHIQADNNYRSLADLASSL